MSLVQISKLTGRIDRVKPEHGPPVVELHLEDNQTVVSVDLRQRYDHLAVRKTNDWYWTAYVETRL